MLLIPTKQDWDFNADTLGLWGGTDHFVRLGAGLSPPAQLTGAGWPINAPKGIRDAVDETWEGNNRMAAWRETSTSMRREGVSTVDLIVETQY